MDGKTAIGLGRPQLYALMRHSCRGFFLAAQDSPTPGYGAASGNSGPSRVLAAQSFPTPGRRPSSDNPAPIRALVAEDFPTRFPTPAPGNTRPSRALVAQAFPTNSSAPASGNSCHVRFLAAPALPTRGGKPVPGDSSRSRAMAAQALPARGSTPATDNSRLRRIVAGQSLPARAAKSLRRPFRALSHHGGSIISEVSCPSRKACARKSHHRPLPGGGGFAVAWPEACVWQPHAQSPGQEPWLPPTNHMPHRRPLPWGWERAGRRPKRQH